MRLRRPARRGAASALLAFLAACGTTPPPAPPAPGTVTHIPPGNAQRDGPEANPPPNLDAVPDAVPQIEPIRIGGPNKPYAINGQTYVPLTDDRAVTETGLASWYGKKFHGHRTASGEAYNMYAMTAAHKTLPIPSYARVRNPANGHEVIVRVNDRGPFSSNRVIDLSYTAALKLGVLGGVQTVEIERITGDDIRTGAAFRRGPDYAAAATAPPTAADAPTTVAVGDLDRPARVGPSASDGKPGFLSRLLHGKPKTDAAAASAPVASGPPQLLPPLAGDVVASAAATPGAGPAPADAIVDLGSAAAADAVPATPGTTTSVTTERLVAAISPSRPGPARNADPVAPTASAPREPRDEQGHAETAAGSGWWVQIGAYKQRDGALDFQHHLVDEQPWLAPLLAVFTDHGLNKLQAGPYRSRADAKSAADRIRAALQLVPTIVEKR